MWITHKHVSPQTYPQLWSKYTGVISWLPTCFHLFSGVIHIIYTQPVDNCGLRWVRRRPTRAQLLCDARVATAAKTGHTGARTWRMRYQGRAAPAQPGPNKKWGVRRLKRPTPHEGINFGYYSTMSMELITTSCRGRSRPSVGAASIASTTLRESSSTTLPKMVCLPCSQGVATVVMKNCEPLVP